MRFSGTCNLCLPLMSSNSTELDIISNPPNTGLMIKANFVQNVDNDLAHNKVWMVKGYFCPFQIIWLFLLMIHILCLSCSMVDDTMNNHQIQMDPCISMDTIICFISTTPKVLSGAIVWAHSVSKDLINWKKVEHAIYPSKPFDKYGCWSGSATVLPGNKPVILYTGIVDDKQTQVQNYAVPANVSDPYLRVWIKPDNNHCVADNVNKTAFRDPTTAWLGKDGQWRTTIGGRSYDTGMSFLYKSKDFMHWTKVSLDVTRYEYYTIGTYDAENDKYIPDKDMVDGGMLIPRTMVLDPNGKQLLQWPVEELETLRGKKVELSNQKLAMGEKVEIKGITAAQADVDVTFSFHSLDKAEPFDPSWDRYDAQKLCSRKGSTVKGGLGPFGLLTLASENLEEYTPVFFRVFKAHDNKHQVLMCSDASRSTLMSGKSSMKDGKDAYRPFRIHECGLER
ncbi:Beta-fructofuranosidase, insoluble isoenzyme 1 [Sesamum angolense]|uniref:Beta-fructofuranosidase, insoluble isoenzyme 1 n=1 Tax=Sesamum angolense TaxID=2727404 RepID=A0AAE2BT20_9LAMI|nr:Beta-fructofuranosidase, insoluble isoenzyme 1 [Sesamum angolense]